MLTGEGLQRWRIGSGVSTEWGGGGGWAGFGEVGDGSDAADLLGRGKMAPKSTAEKWGGDGRG